MMLSLPWTEIGLSLVLLCSVTGFAETTRADDRGRGTDTGAGSVDLKLPQGHPIWIETAAMLTRDSLNYGGTAVNPGNENFSGIELALRLISSSNRTRSFLVGFDLRQKLSSENGSGSSSPALNYFGTKLGIRLEYRLPLRYEPAVSGSWFFGDTLVTTVRNEQFNGNSGELSLSFQPNTVRWFATLGWGSYNQGTGFILVPQPGTDNVISKAISIGAQWSFASVWPDWLTMTPPSGPVDPF